MKCNSNLVNSIGYWKAIRICTLDDWAGRRTKKDWILQQVRNEIVHGGSIATDMDVISSHSGDSDRLEAWKEEFKKVLKRPILHS